MGWTCNTYGGENRFIQVFVGGSEGKKPLEKDKMKEMATKDGM